MGRDKYFEDPGKILLHCPVDVSNLLMIILNYIFPHFVTLVISIAENLQLYNTEQLTDCYQTCRCGFCFDNCLQNDKINYFSVEQLPAH